MTRRPSPESVAGAYLPLLARAYADKARAPKNAGKLTWTEALAKAPWSSRFPAEQEEAFRRAYAERLVERKLALPVGRSRTSGPSGENRLTQVALRADPSDIARWDEAARSAGLDRNSFLRRAAGELADRVLAKR